MTKQPLQCEAARVMVPGMSFRSILPWLAGAQTEQWDQELSPSPCRVQGLLQVRAHAFAMVDAFPLGSWALYIARFLEYYTADVRERFRAPAVAEAEERLRCKRCTAYATPERHWMIPFRQLLWIVISCDICSPLSPAAEDVPPSPTKRRRPAASPVKATKPRLGECFKWMDGKRSDRDCPYKHYCARCGSVQHDCRRRRSVGSGPCQQWCHLLPKVCPRAVHASCVVRSLLHVMRSVSMLL